MTHLETGLQTAAATADAAVPKSLVTTAGDILYATASAVLARLGLGAAGTVLGGGASAPAWVNPPGYEYDYAQRTSNLTVSGTSGAQTNVITGNAVTYDGSTSVYIEAFIPEIVTATGDQVTLELWDASTSIGIAATVVNTDVVGTPVLVRKKLTPSAAGHTYALNAYRVTSNGTIVAGTGGAGLNWPAYLRVVKA